MRSIGTGVDFEMERRSSIGKASTSKALTPRGRMATRSMTRQREQDLVFQVLDNPSLREEILKRVILRKDDTVVDRGAASTLRLVDKAWNESVIWILRQSQNYLYQLISEDSNELKAFTRTFASSPQDKHSFPPLALQFTEDVSLPENATAFSRFVRICGKGLVQLVLQVDEDGQPSSGGALPRWSLPQLRKLQLDIPLYLGGGGDADDNPPVGGAGEDNISSRWIKALLTGARRLTEVDIQINPMPPFHAPPGFSIFQSITLPQQLTEIRITGSRLNSDFLEMLARCPLPKLTSLTFTIGDEPLLPAGLLFRVLDNLRLSLKSLLIYQDFVTHPPPDSVNLIRFPVMENLEELSILSTNVELEDPAGHQNQNLQQFFPNLRTFCLLQQTTEMARKWTTNSTFTEVTTLGIMIADRERFAEHDRVFLASLTREMAYNVDAAFPNLRKLEVAVSQRDIGGLEYVFQEMGRLTKLTLNIVGETTAETRGAWDSILTGVPMETVAGANADPNFWDDDNEEQFRNINVLSIKNLQGLTSLSLKDHRRFHQNPHHFQDLDASGENPFPLVSAFTLEFALMTMPNLVHFRRKCPFEYSRETHQMTVKWRREGRRLIYVTSVCEPYAAVN